MQLTKGDSPLQIDGPSGQLEAILSTPQDDTKQAIAVACHPHPLYGGTMTNKVVHTLAKTFVSEGVPCIRFNFRGVGNSAGEFGDAIGETNDALAVIEYAQQHFPDRDIWLGGFSFGAYVSLCASLHTAVSRLITIAPAVNMYELDDYTPPQCPWLLIQGSEDEIVPVDAVKNWAQSVLPEPSLVLIPEAGHFFHGKLVDLRDAITDFLQQQ